MSAQVAYNAVVVFLHMLLYGVSYVAHETVWLGSLGSNLKAFLSHPYELFFLWCCLSYDEHSRSIGIVTVENCGEVNIHDVALLQYVFLLWNAVAHYLVDACANAHWESLITQAGRCRTMVLAVFPAYFVDLESCHTLVYVFCYLVEHTGVHYSAFAYALNLLRRLYQVTCWDEFPLVFPIHYFLVHLRWLLSF